MTYRPDARALASFAVAGTLLLGGCSLFKAASRPAPDMKVASTPAKVARGEYLAKHVNACLACHSPLNEAHLAVPGQEGAGNRHFRREDGLPGNLYSTNLTPDPETGLGNWTDGEIARAVREGVSKDGHALFPLMPYPNYKDMSDEDLEAIIAYLRSLKPIKSATKPRELDFPLNLIVNTIPKPLGAPVGRGARDGAARGEHLLKMASCNECHTPMEKGTPDMNRYMAGGHEFKDDGKVFVMPNLTQDPETGLGKWTDKQIENAIRFGQRPDGKQLSGVMPWGWYGGMNEADMKALIAYMRTIPAKKPEIKK